MRTITPLAAALAFALGALAPAGLPAQVRNDTSLPDIGSSAAQVITPEQEAEYGAYTLHELRRLGYVLDDPLVNDWLQGVGDRLASNTVRSSQHFTFFVMRSREINAFATLGAYVGVNVGLILIADNEDELAGVMAHEISHVVQNHVLRAVEKNNQNTLPIALAMLGAILVAQKAGGNSSGNATEAVIAAGTGLMAQQEINFTRANESEADRIGIQTLARSGYDPMAMANFFGRMQSATRADTGGDSPYKAPDFLQDHPVTTTRIAEATERARQIERAPAAHIDGGPVQDSLLLPQQLSTHVLAPGSVRQRGSQFGWAQERLRVLSAESYGAAIAEYHKLEVGHPQSFGDARRYGLAVALSLHGETGAATDLFHKLLERHPDAFWIELGLAEAERIGGDPKVAQQRYEAVLRRMPGNRGVILSYAQALGEIGTADAGRRAQTILRPLIADSNEDAIFQHTFARASELAGDTVRAAEAYAESAFLNGRAQDALSQLEALKTRSDLNYYQRSRIEARIAVMTPIVLELRKDGVRPADADRQQQDLKPRSGLTMHFGSDSRQNCPGYNGFARASSGQARVGQTSYGLASLGQATFSSVTSDRCNSDDDPAELPLRR
jgi:predicted Zn-dependent protease